MQIVVCALAKNENLYINEWVKHYVDLGFDKIYLFDNNDPETDNVMNHIDTPYQKYVDYQDIRGQKCDKLQQKIYTNFYKKYGTSFNWCFFCDIDEFLTGISNIHEFLSKKYFNHALQIRVMWKLFGDDDQIERDMNLPIRQAFRQELNYSLNRNLVDRGNLERQGKFFIRGGLCNVIITSPHFASYEARDNIVPSVLPSGRVCRSKVVINEAYYCETVYLNHYMTKSLSEFIAQKLNRTDAVYGDISIKLDYYWRINKKTPEKLAYLKDRGLL